MFEAERQQASFDKQQLSRVIYDSQEGVDSFIQRQKIVENDHILHFDPSTIHRSR